MQSARLHRLGTWLALALGLIPVILAVIAEIQDNLTALGVPTSELMKAPLYAGAAVIVIKGLQAVVEILKQHVALEGPGRHGLGTYVGLGLTIIPAVLAIFADLQDQAVLLGVSPEGFVKAALIGGLLTTGLKGVQAAAQIWRQYTNPPQPPADPVS